MQLRDKLKQQAEDMQQLTEERRVLQQQVDNVVDLKNQVFSLTEDKKELANELERRARDGEGSQL